MLYFIEEKRLAIEKHDTERSEKMSSRSEECNSTTVVSTRALLDRIEAQQRRIAALEIAEMVNITTRVTCNLHND